MKLTLPQLQAAADVDLGVSSPLLIDQQRVDGFADVTEDHQWIHVDGERAKDGPYGTTIAHGFLVLSLIPRLFFELVDLSDAGVVVNYGVDKLRFLQPVPVGSEIELHARLASGQKRLGGAFCRVRCDVRLRATGKRAVTAELLLLVLPAPDQDGAAE
ncbi:MAG: MaoC family dehydratase [Acidobacteria bacterium]|nr:MAG: MaoC family dehydratase [Acidobacteriota bacterium]